MIETPRVAGCAECRVMDAKDAQARGGSLAAPAAIRLGALLLGTLRVRLQLLADGLI